MSKPAEILSLGFIHSEKLKLKHAFYSNQMLPFVYLTIFLLFTAVTVMHIQVIIRFFSSVPFLFWYLAYLFELKGVRSEWHLPDAYVLYSLVYGTIGIVLYAKFLPPA